MGIRIGRPRRQAPQEEDSFMFTVAEAVYESDKLSTEQRLDPYELPAPSKEYALDVVRADHERLDTYVSSVVEHSTIISEFSDGTKRTAVVAPGGIEGLL